MNDQVKADDFQNKQATIKENYEDSYWLKKYGVSTEELKQSETDLGVRQRILKAAFDNKALA